MADDDGNYSSEEGEAETEFIYAMEFREAKFLKDLITLVAQISTISRFQVSSDGLEFEVIDQALCMPLLLTIYPDSVGLKDFEFSQGGDAGFVFHLQLNVLLAILQPFWDNEVLRMTVTVQLDSPSDTIILTTGRETREMAMQRVESFEKDWDTLIGAFSSDTQVEIPASLFNPLAHKSIEKEKPVTIDITDSRVRLSLSDSENESDNSSTESEDVEQLISENESDNSSTESEDGEQLIPRDECISLNISGLLQLELCLYRASWLGPVLDASESILVIGVSRRLDMWKNLALMRFKFDLERCCLDLIVPLESGFWRSTRRLFPPL